MAEVLCLRMDFFVRNGTTAKQKKKKKKFSHYPLTWWKVGESCPKKHFWSFVAKQRRLQPDWLDTTTPPSRTRRIRDVQYLSEWKRFGSQLMTYPGD